MKQIIQNGPVFKISDMESANFKLPVGTYNLGFSNLGGFYLEKTEDFKLPTKIYGDLSLIDRCIQVYRNRDRNFGLLLSGLRGSGKSLTMKKLAVELNQPIIIINSDFREVSNSLIKFLTDPILGDCTILLDEFEKRFTSDDVTPLTLLDGPYNTHHFYILTVNEKDINRNLINRPGRIYYHKSYEGVSEDTILEVGKDLLNNKSFVNDLVNVCSDIRDLSFDMLISVINDVNLFNESPAKCLKYFEFDSHRSTFVNFYQKINGQNRLVNDSPLWIDPRCKTFWLDDCYLVKKNGEVIKAELLLPLENMVKISPKKFYLKFTVDSISLGSDNNVKIEDLQTTEIEFEIQIGVQPKVSYVF